MANPRLVAVRPQEYDGAEDTPPARTLNGDEQTVSPAAAPVANFHVSTSEKTIPDPSPSYLPTSTTTQQPASGTRQGPGSSTLSPEHAHENPPSTPEKSSSGRRDAGGK